LLKSLLKKPAARQLQPDPTDVNLARLRVYSRLGIVFAVIWFLVNRPFWRHLFVALWAMAFVTLVLPAEMMFFVRHPVLASAVPLAAGFVAANVGRSPIRVAHHSHNTQPINRNSNHHTGGRTVGPMSEGPGRPGAGGCG